MYYYCPDVNVSEGWILIGTKIEINWTNIIFKFQCLHGVLLASVVVRQIANRPLCLGSVLQGGRNWVGYYTDRYVCFLSCVGSSGFELQWSRLTLNSPTKLKCYSYAALGRCSIAEDAAKRKKKKKERGKYEVPTLPEIINPSSTTLEMQETRVDVLGGNTVFGIPQSNGSTPPDSATETGTFVRQPYQGTTLPWCFWICSGSSST